jgi:hypothetical protein
MIASEDEIRRECSTNGEKRNAHRFVVGKPESKRTLGRLKYVQMDNIKMDLREMDSGGMGWIHLAQGRDRWKALMNKVMNLGFPCNAGKFLSRCTNALLSRRAHLHGYT